MMQEGAGVRQMIEDELRSHGLRLARPHVPLELGLQESVKTAVQRGYGVTFISRTSVEAELAVRHARRRARRGARAGARDPLVVATGGSLTRGAEAFLEFAREQALA